MLDHSTACRRWTGFVLPLRKCTAQLQVATVRRAGAAAAVGSGCGGGVHRRAARFSCGGAAASLKRPRWLGAKAAQGSLASSAPAAADAGAARLTDGDGTPPCCLSNPITLRHEDWGQFKRISIEKRSTMNERI